MANSKRLGSMRDTVTQTEIRHGRGRGRGTGRVGQTGNGERGDGFIPFVLTVDRVLSTPVAPDLPCHEGGNASSPHNASLFFTVTRERGEGGEKNF